MKDLLRRLHEDESGHAVPFYTTMIGAPGVIALTAGIVGGWDIVTIIGGAALTVGLILAGVGRHIKVDYGIFEELDDLSGRGA